MLNWSDYDSIDAVHIDAVNFVLFDFPQLKSFIFHPKKSQLRCSCEQLLSEASTLSSGEQTLVRMALDLWDGSGHTEVLSACDCVGAHRVELFIEAIQFLRGD